MRDAWLALAGAARVELKQLAHHRLFVALTCLAAVSLLVMLSLFSMMASNAPLAVVDEDHSDASGRFVEAMRNVPNAFLLRLMESEAAHETLLSGRLVGVVTIPSGFAARVEAGDTVPLEVRIDNVNEDILFDLERALPSAILAFGHAAGLPGLRVTLVEHDLLPKDILFLRYLAVSALALVAFVIATSLAALAVAREWEGKTVKLLHLSPASLGAVLLGKLAVAGGLSTAVVLLTAAVVVAGYGAVPSSPWTAFFILAVSVILFSSVGAWIGAVFRRTLPVVPLVFGLAMPLFIDCGALEPTRFDGELVWLIAHVSPLYYVVGVLEWAFFGVRVTPETTATNVLVLVVLAAVSGLAAITLLRRATARSRAWR
jgi:ABC-2 type transport system permease protein